MHTVSSHRQKLVQYSPVFSARLHCSGEECDDAASTRRDWSHLGQSTLTQLLNSTAIMASCCSATLECCIQADTALQSALPTENVSLAPLDSALVAPLRCGDGPSSMCIHLAPRRPWTPRRAVWLGCAGSERGPHFWATAAHLSAEAQVLEQTGREMAPFEHELCLFLRLAANGRARLVANGFPCLLLLAWSRGQPLLASP